MKALGLSCGRKNGNTEILLKEALMGVDETCGAEVEFIRFQELSVKPCKGCEGCMKGYISGGDGLCVQKNDHMSFLIDELGKCDAVILGAPAYELMPPGLLILISDRMLGAGKKYRDICLQKPKIGATISVGGTDWTNLVLPLSNIALSMLIGNLAGLIDQMLLTYTPAVGQAVLREKALARARKLGRNVGEAMKLPVGKVKYVGEEEETCPLCHSNLLQIRGKSVVCPICDIEGSIALEGDRYKVTFSDEWLQKTRWGEWGSKRHINEIIQGHQEYGERIEEVKAKIEKYKLYKGHVAPPALKGKRISDGQ